MRIGQSAPPETANDTPMSLIGLVWQQFGRVHDAARSDGPPKHVSDLMPKSDPTTRVGAMATALRGHESAPVFPPFPQISSSHIAYVPCFGGPPPKHVSDLMPKSDPTARVGAMATALRGHESAPAF
jgi:hypothetical protein